MVIKRILIAAASALGVCAVIYCGESDFGETLRWKSAAEFPVNFEQEIDDNALKVLSFSYSDGSIGALLDLGMSTFTTNSREVNAIRKVEEPEVSYRVSVANGTSVKLRLYGLLFHKGYDAATMSPLEFYNAATPSAAISDGCINLMGNGGLNITPYDTVSFKMPPSQGPPLSNMIVHQDTVSWRWVALLEANEANKLNDADATGKISARLVIRVAGVNSFDSLFKADK